MKRAKVTDLVKLPINNVDDMFGVIYYFKENLNDLRKMKFPFHNAVYNHMVKKYRKTIEYYIKNSTYHRILDSDFLYMYMVILSEKEHDGNLEFTIDKITNKKCNFEYYVNIDLDFNTIDIDMIPIKDKLYEESFRWNPIDKFSYRITLDMNQPMSSRITVLSEAYTDEYHKTNRYTIDMVSISTQDKRIDPYSPLETQYLGIHGKFIVSIILDTLKQFVFEEEKLE